MKFKKMKKLKFTEEMLDDLKNFKNEDIQSMEEELVMKLKKENIIKSKPILLCSSCFKENCNGKHFLNWIKKLINLIKK